MPVCGSNLNCATVSVPLAKQPDSCGFFLITLEIINGTCGRVHLSNFFLNLDSYFESAQWILVHFMISLKFKRILNYSFFMVTTVIANIPELQDTYHLCIRNLGHRNTQLDIVLFYTAFTCDASLIWICKFLLSSSLKLSYKCFSSYLLFCTSCVCEHRPSKWYFSFLNAVSAVCLMVWLSQHKFVILTGEICFPLLPVDAD